MNSSTSNYVNGFSSSSRLRTSPALQYQTPNEICMVATMGRSSEEKSEPSSAYRFEAKEKVKCFKDRLLEDAQVIDRRLREDDQEPEYKVHFYGHNKRTDTWVTKKALRKLDKRSPYDDPTHIHYSMLKDAPRARAYTEAINGNSDLFEGKYVVDIGGGMGILSLKCAKAGAKKVFMVEPATVVEYATQVIRANGYEDVIKCINADVDGAELPHKVDILVAEWMGYALFYENAMAHIITAREKFLKRGGMMFPDYGQLFIAGIQDLQSKAQFWENVEGFDMSCVSELATRNPVIGAGIGTLVTNSVCIKSIDLNTCTYEDTFVNSSFTLDVINSSTLSKCNAFVMWFDVHFLQCKPVVTLSTGKDNETSHWMQVHLYVQQPDPKPIPGSKIRGHIRMIPNSHNPNIEMSIELCVDYQVLDPKYPTEIKKIRRQREYVLAF